MHWYAVRTATRQERKAAEALQEAGLEVYAPQERRLAVLPRKDGETAVTGPLIKGWIFARGTRQQMQEAEALEGVSSVASYRNEEGRLIPAPLNAQDRALLAIIRDLEAKGEFDRTKVKRYTPAVNEKVKVVGGLFQGSIGTVLETIVEARRAKLAIKTGRLEVSMDHLEAFTPELLEAVA